MSTTNKTEQSNTAEVQKGKNVAKKAMLGLAAALVVAGGAAGVTYAISEADAYVGTVNGQRLSRDAYDRDLEMRKKQYSTRMSVDFNSDQGKQMLQTLKGDVLEQLISRNLMLVAAKEKHIMASPEEIETKMKSIRTNFPDPATYAKTLKDNGITEDALHDNVSEGTKLEKLRNSLTKDATVSAEEVRTFYDRNTPQYKVAEEVTASHILLKTEKEAKDVYSKIKAGGDFSALAKQFSQDPGSKERGGELGSFAHGRMVPEFDKAAFALVPGAVSPPVKTQFGFHVIKAVAKTTPRTKPFDEVKGTILDQLLKEKRDDAFRKWTEKQRAAAKVEIRQQYQAAAAPAPAPAPPAQSGSGSASAPQPAH